MAYNKRRSEESCYEPRTDVGAAVSFNVNKSTKETTLETIRDLLYGCGSHEPLEMTLSDVSVPYFGVSTNKQLSKTNTLVTAG